MRPRGVALVKPGILAGITLAAVFLHLIGAVMEPLLFADRFFVTQPEQAIDLATGDAVWIRPVSLANRRAQDAWLRRCAALSALSHPHLVPLADFGLAGQASCFEAWVCKHPPSRWKARDPHTAASLSEVAAFLMSRGLAPGRLQWASVIDRSGRLALMPDDETGLTLSEDRDGDIGCERSAARLAQQARRLEALVADCGGPDEHSRPAGLTPRPLHGADPACAFGEQAAELTERLADVLKGGVSGRPRVVRFAIGNGPVRMVLWRMLARTSRLQGYIPVASAVLQGDGLHAVAHERWREAVVGRHVLLVHPGTGSHADVDAALFFLSLGLSSDLPHVLLHIEEPSMAGGSSSPAAWAGESRTLRVREESAGYLTGSPAGASLLPVPAIVPPPIQAWTPGRSHDALYSSPVTLAVFDAAASGRHAQAERLLRETMGRSARRHDEPAAGEAALALGRLLLVRGQLTPALRAFDMARQHFEQARLAARAICAAVFMGLGWTDAGRFSEAEAALRSAAIAAKEMSELSTHAFAGLALARCLYWQDRHAEALEWLHLPPSAGHTPEEPAVEPVTTDTAEWIRLGRATCARERLCGASTTGGLERVGAGAWAIGGLDPGVARACMAARIAIATDDLASAGRAAAEARDRAERSGNPTELAAACCAKAALFGALGDITLLRQQVKEGTDAARRAHAPLRALRLRVLLAQALVNAGREVEARPLVARLSRWDPRRLPVVVGLPLERLIRGEGRTRAPSPRGPGLAPGSQPRSAMVEAVVEILGVCQAFDDEAAALRQVAAILRERMRAVSVACFGRERDVTMVLAADGGRQLAEAVARRAIDAGLAISPSSTESGLEAGVPVRFAGAIIGAFGCRWAADVMPDWAHAGAVLAAASAAVAPCLRTALDRRALPEDASGAAEDEIVGISEATANLRREIARAAPAPFNVVIEGESGTGKELVARAIHRLGPRRHRPLCALNCAALTDDLIEAELFGHARGAFTGAVTERKGLFEEADRGILVLDEVSELTARAQAKLLRAVQEGEVRRIGENFSRSVDVRIIAATNRPLRPAADAGAFRRDLLYRLEVIRIAVPPLRSRVEDIPLLAAHFWRAATARLESRCTLAPATLAALARYDWPGNVRELQNVMAALAVAAGRRGSVGSDRLPTLIAERAAADAGARNLDDARRVFEATFVRAALARAGGRRAQAAHDLGLTRQGLAKLMARLGIE